MSWNCAGPAVRARSFIGTAIDLAQIFQHTNSLDDAVGAAEYRVHRPDPLCAAVLRDRLPFILYERVDCLSMTANSDAPPLF